MFLRRPDTTLKRALILILRTRFQRGSPFKFRPLKFDKTISFQDSLDWSVRLTQNNPPIFSPLRGQVFPKSQVFEAGKSTSGKLGRVKFYSAYKATCDFVAHFWFHKFVIKKFQINRCVAILRSSFGYVAFSLLDYRICDLTLVRLLIYRFSRLFNYGFNTAMYIPVIFSPQTL